MIPCVMKLGWLGKVLTLWKIERERKREFVYFTVRQIERKRHKFSMVYSTTGFYFLNTGLGHMSRQSMCTGN